MKDIYLRNELRCINESGLRLQGKALRQSLQPHAPTPHRLSCLIRHSPRVQRQGSHLRIPAALDPFQENDFNRNRRHSSSIATASQADKYL